MIDCLAQFILRQKHDVCNRSQATAAVLNGPWTALLSLKNQDPTDRPSGQLAEQEDIRQSRQGDPDAFRRLVERHQPHVSKLLWRFTRDKECHEELVQETFVQAYFSLPTYKIQAPFEHWLTRIATRVGYRFWKQKSRHQHQPLMDNEWDNLVQAENEPTSPNEAAELIHHLLAQLPPRDRLVLTLRFLEQCTIVETAQRTGWSLPMVKVQTHRAKQKLKKLAEKADIEIEL